MLINSVGLKQQSSSESKFSEDGQLLDPQTRPSWHSTSELQSPSSSPQGIPDAQNSSSPIDGCEQQSISKLKPSEAGQLFEPHKRPFWHSAWVSQSPSFSEQVLQLHNPISPLLTVAQLARERVS